MYTIYILPGSNLHSACVELYQRHHEANDGSDRCFACGLPTPCPARRHASAVIRAAGEDPRWHDVRLPAAQAQGPRLGATTPAGVRHPSQRPASPHPSLDTPGVSGYRLGGYGRRSEVPYVEYER